MLQQLIWLIVKHSVGIDPAVVLSVVVLYCLKCLFLHSLTQCPSSPVWCMNYFSLRRRLEKSKVWALIHSACAATHGYPYTTGQVYGGEGGQDAQVSNGSGDQEDQWKSEYVNFQQHSACVLPLSKPCVLEKKYFRIVAVLKTWEYFIRLYIIIYFVYAVESAC